MNADLSQILIFGTLAVTCGVSALVLLVRRDLAPAVGLDGGGRWFLGAGLGLGVIAFSIKLVIISTLATFPENTIDALLPDPLLARLNMKPLTELPSAPSEPRDLWRPLPQTPPGPAASPAMVALGEQLFHDANLSADRTIACASCHDVRRGAGDDGKPTSTGIGRQKGGRNAPTVYNAAWQARLFWDGRAASLEEQAQGPLVNPVEMGMPSLEAVEARVGADPAYGPLFATAFADERIDITRIAAAIAAFERTLVTADSPYDRFVRGDQGALSEQQQRGMWLFADLGCATCHAGPNFSGASLVGPKSPYAVLLAERSALGRRYRLAADKGRGDGVWRIPSLRNVALTAPYFHNGAVADLSEAVRVMAETQINALLDEDRPIQVAWTPSTRKLEKVERKTVSEAEVATIVAFLEALTSDRLRATVKR